MSPVSRPADSSEPSAEVDAFLARLPDDARDALERLRRTIRAAAPEASEGIGYGVPMFRHRGRPLVSFGAGKAHCSFYVQSPAVIDAFGDELTRYDTSTGTIRFKAAKPLPDELVTRLVHARLAEVGGASR
jgi:uncharacterized protein YdhG (YjbR/CyaY superfamily)